MTAKRRGFQSVTEHCENCNRNTTHQISVEIRTESKETENVKFSREPYRVALCEICGERTSQRMNNA
ncbi:DUF7835 family putative zinc beta-ribbon protein [Haladaptatus sp. NG-WS-4]